MRLQSVGHYENDISIIAREVLYREQLTAIGREAVLIPYNVDDA